LPSFEDARRLILQAVPVLGAEVVPVLDAVGRVLAADVAAPRDLPAWDNSAMDGWAVRAVDAGPGARLRLAGFIPAGAEAGSELARGTAVRILTGAPLPAGADTVVPLEDAEEEEGQVVLPGPVHAGAHVRRRGEDVRAGETVMPAGTVVGPAEVSLLASCSRLSVAVVRRPRVAILSTGDELVAPGEPLGPGKIHDSNGLALAAAVAQAGALPALLGVARDERAALQALLREGLAADVLVTSAGVSMGDRDYVREVLEELGVRQVFWKVDLKPGRPTTFALRGATPVFSLPGNPVATLLTFEEFVRPALLRMMGHRRVLRPLATATLDDEVRHRPGRVQLLRVRLERRADGLHARSSGSQDTGFLMTQLRADGIALIPAASGTVAPGTPVQVQVLRPGAELGEG
jgi:molybdopterin molybdotransferase